MAVIESINSFTKGMVQDLDKSLVSKQNYLEAHNFRLNTVLGDSAGAFENIEGNNLIHAVASSITPTGFYIIGAVNIRDTVVAFMTNNTNSRIVTFPVNLTTEMMGTVTVVYDDALNGSAGALGFNTAYPIKAVVAYESPNIQKVYWTDGYNNIRYCNIAANLTTDGNPYTLGINTYMSPDKFDFLPAFIPTKPTLKNIVGGTVQTGIVAYSYQLYKSYGATTTFSPLSDPIHVVTDSDVLTNTLYYKGNNAPTNSGKGFVMLIDATASVGYDRLRMIRVLYTEAGSLPSITICNEIEIPTSGGVIQVTDVGDTISQLTIDEFNTSSTELFKCQDLSIKDNRLFAANITQSRFTVDPTWDARAVRFRSDGIASLADSRQSPITLHSNFSDWNLYTTTFDGINDFNSPSNDGLSGHQFMYQADNATLGAEGPHIKIDFLQEEFVLDTSNDNTTFYTNAPTDSTDISYKSFASPWKTGKLSWQRDEVYRLFVVFGNDRNQTSDPKWICDLRMPSYHDAAYCDLSYISGTDVRSMKLFPRVMFKSLPSNAKWAQIYRVKRESSDRSIVTQALAVPTFAVTGGYEPTTMSNANLSTDGVELVKLVSPEISINKNIQSKSSDYLEYVNKFDPSDVRVTTANQNTVHKLLDSTLVPYSSDTKANVIKGLGIAPQSGHVDNITILNGKTYSNYNVTNRAKGCTGLLVNYSNTSWSAEGVPYAIVNYKTNVYGSQYGGNTYEDRMNNVSIPCSDVITTINTWKNISYGDTFINYFDVSTLLFDVLTGKFNYSICESVYVPLESSINCDLRDTTSSCHKTYNTILAVLRQEESGDHLVTDDSNGSTYDYNQEFDLYSYNPVYSQQLDIKYAVSQSLDVNLNTVFDCMIKNSSRKYNNELSDSFTKFAANDFIEVDTTYGPLKAIHNINNKMLFWQENAVGAVSVNDRSIVQDTNSAAIVLGTGGILDRFDYINTRSGTDSKFSVLKTNTGVYWYYPKDNSLYRITSNIDNLSKGKMMQSWFTVNTAIYPIVSCVYDSNYNHAIFTFMNAGKTAGKTIIFDENIDSFSAIYDYSSRLYIPYNVSYMSIYRYNNTDLIYIHNSLLKEKCCFYSIYPASAGAEPSNSTKYVNSTIKVLFNDNYANTKVFDNFSYLSTASVNGVELYDNTFSSIRCYNNFQNSDYCTLVYGNKPPKGSLPLQRDEREWTTDVPRNAVNKTYTSNPDVFNVANLDKTRSFRERIRDKYMITDFTYTNTSNRRFVVPYVAVKYRISPR